MFSIKIKDDFLELNDDTSIALELVSPLFDNEFIKGSFSYPSKAKANPHNLRILGFAKNIENENPLHSKVEILTFLDGIPFKKGLLKIISIKKDINFYLIFDSGSLADEFKERKITELDYGPDYELYDNPVFKTDKMLDSATAPIGTFDYVFFPMYNPKFYTKSEEPLNEQYSGFINFFENQKFKQNISSTNSNIKFSVSPFFYLIPLLKKVFSNYDYSVFGDFIQDEELKTLVVTNNFALDTYEFVPANNNYLNVFSQFFKTNNHIPEITIAELTNDLKNYFGLAIIINPTDKNVQFLFLKNLINSNEFESLDSILEDDYEVSQEENKGYKLKHGFDENDEDFDDYNQSKTEDLEIIIGEGKNEIESNIGTMPYTTKAHDANVAFIIPISSQSGTSDEPKLNDEENFPELFLGKNEFSFRLLFYRGMQPDGNGVLYPLGSSMDFNISQYLNVNYVLNWKGEKGLYNMLWKDWINFLMRTKTIKVLGRINEKDLMKIDFTKKYLYRGSKYFIKKINVDLPLKGKALFELSQI